LYILWLAAGIGNDFIAQQSAAATADDVIARQLATVIEPASQYVTFIRSG
jgi:hypothetical protein